MKGPRMSRSINRRSFSTLLAGVLLAGASSPGTAKSRSQSQTGEAGSSEHDMSDAPAHWSGDEHIYLLAYPGMTALDLVGPQYMFSSLMGARVEIVAKSREPIVSDTGLTLVPDRVFDDLPDGLTVIFVPGGTTGTLQALRDPETVAFVQAAGVRADYVTSVCTGSLLLGKAGLLDGYRATSHWLTLPSLSHFGAQPVQERVVIDRNRITGAGVSAGLDFGLSLVGRFRDANYAETVQLLCEYAPDPPFNSGSPDTAKHHQIEALQGMFAGFLRSVADEA